MHMHCQEQCPCIVRKKPQVPNTARQAAVIIVIINIAIIENNMNVGCAKLLQSCLRLCDPARLLCPWDSPGKNT